MAPTPLTVICPHCQKEVIIDEALAHQFDQSKLAEEKAKLHKQMEEWQKEQQMKLRESAALEMKALRQENEQKSKALEEARQMELKLRQEKNRLDDERRAFELEKQRQLDLEREKIRRTTAEELQQQHRLIVAEQEKRIADMTKALEEARQKAGQGSQQLQGEVLELELEAELRRLFPVDEIEEVAKGVHGADIVQKVRDGQGRQCGLIVWESKRTKHWTEGWVGKLKEDLLRVKGDVAVLVTVVLPEGIRHFGHRDGIYVSTFESFASLAGLLRQTLIQHQIVRSSVVGKNEKMEMVYNYFLSSEFRQRVEAIASAFNSMKSDLDNEKKVMAKLWAKREKEIDRVVINTASMHGELQGLIGSALPKVESLEMDSLLLGFEEG